MLAREPRPDTRASDTLLIDRCSLHASNRWQAFANHVPRIATVRRTEQLAVARAEVKSGGIIRIGFHVVAQNRFEGVLLRQTTRQRLPRISAVARAIDAQLGFGRATKLVRFNWNDVNGISIVRIDLHRETKIGWQTLADVLPRITGVVAAINAPVMLQEHAIGIRRMAHNLVHALSPFGVLLIGRHELRADTLVARLPILASIFGSINT